MSKKHKKNRGSQPVPAPAAEAAAAPAEETLIGVDDLGGGEGQTAEQPTSEFSPDNAAGDTAAPPKGEEQEQGPTTPGEEQPTEPVKEPDPDVPTAESTSEVIPDPPPEIPDPPPEELKVVVPEPKPTMVKVTHVVIPSKPAAPSAPSVQVKGSMKFVRPTAIKRIGSVVKTTRVPTVQNTVKKLDDLRNHSVIGIKVITMFNEYEEMRRTFDLSNPVYRNKCARKLYDIMTICCPHRNGANAQSMSELANIVFTRFCNGIGTLYTDKSLLAGDYNLPTPSEAIKFDAFYGAMYQLAECAKFGTRITFNVKSLETLLQSTGASLAIRDIKARLDAKMAQRDQEAKLGK